MKIVLGSIQLKLSFTQFSTPTSIIMMEFLIRIFRSWILMGSYLIHHLRILFRRRRTRPFLVLSCDTSIYLSRTDLTFAELLKKNFLQMKQSYSLGLIMQLVLVVIFWAWHYISHICFWKYYKTYLEIFL